MLRITIFDARTDRIHTFTKDVIHVGRSLANDVVVPRTDISRRHATITVDRSQDAVFIEDASSTSGTYVGGMIVRGRQLVTHDDEVRIGGVTLRMWLDLFRPEGADDPREQGFLNSLRVNPKDDDTRAVYADWLEEHGKRPQASFLRAQVAARAVKSADDPVFKEVSARLRKLAPLVGIGWRARVAMTLIEAETCGAQKKKKNDNNSEEGKEAALGFELECPKRWDEMMPTAIDGVRHCNTCNQEVVYCTSLEEARAHASDGGCVLVDIGAPRDRNDLQEYTGGSRGRIAPPTHSRHNRGRH